VELRINFNELQRRIDVKRRRIASQVNPQRAYVTSHREQKNEVRPGPTDHETTVPNKLDSAAFEGQLFVRNDGRWPDPVFIRERAHCGRRRRGYLRPRAPY